MHRLIFAGVLAVAACAAKAPTVTAYRAAGAPIWSAAAFQSAQIAGAWQQVAAFQPEGAACTAGRVEFQPAPGGLRVEGKLCLAGALQHVSGLAEPVGPGRLRIGGEDWWVLWVDSGYRTLAIGTPSGRFGFILDRGAIPADRLAAAAEIFDFNGYVEGALRPF